VAPSRPRLGAPPSTRPVLALIGEEAPRAPVRVRSPRLRTAAGTAPRRAIDRQRGVDPVPGAERGSLPRACASTSTPTVPVTASPCARARCRPSWSSRSTRSAAVSRASAMASRSPPPSSTDREARVCGVARSGNQSLNLCRRGVGFDADLVEDGGNHEDALVELDKEPQPLDFRQHEQGARVTTTLTGYAARACASWISWSSSFRE
jgi:hypothetical protein